MAGVVTQEFLEVVDDNVPARVLVTQMFFETTDDNVPPTNGRVTQIFLEYIDYTPAAGAASSSLLTFVGP